MPLARSRVVRLTVSKPNLLLLPLQFYGPQIIDVFEDLHGTKCNVVPYTKAEYAADMGQFLPLVPAHYKHTWGVGDWKWEGEVGPRGQNFGSLAKRYWAVRS